MLLPSVLSGVEEWCHLSGCRIASFSGIILAAVAPGAGIGEIGEAVTAAA
jgi:hypothetical protein